MQFLKMFYWGRIFRRLVVPCMILANLISLVNLVVPHLKTRQIEPELAFWVSEFETVGLEHGVKVDTSDLIVRFQDDSHFGGPHEVKGVKNARTLAWCELKPNKTPVIEVSRQVYQKASEWGRRQLLFHELGHCILHLDHDDRTLANGMPNSIMNTFLIGEAYGPETAWNYDSQLFGSYAVNQK